jgi:hypothetical protein
MRRLLPLLISTVLLGAQAPPDSTAYSVAYVDILPASGTAAITAIKQYRDAAEKTTDSSGSSSSSRSDGPHTSASLKRGPTPQTLIPMPHRRMPRTSEIRSTP